MRDRRVLQVLGERHLILELDQVRAGLVATGQGGVTMEGGAAGKERGRRQREAGGQQARGGCCRCWGHSSNSADGVLSLALCHCLQVVEARIMWRRHVFTHRMRVEEDARDPGRMVQSFRLVASVRLFWGAGERMGNLLGGFVNGLINGYFPPNNLWHSMAQWLFGPAHVEGTQSSRPVPKMCGYGYMGSNALCEQQPLSAAAGCCCAATPPAPLATPSPPHPDHAPKFRTS